jgi:hypothetical protein
MERSKLLKQSIDDPVLVGGTPALRSVRKQVDANNTYWHSGIGLDQDHYYILAVNESSRWTIDNGATQLDLHGTGTMNGEEIGIPKNPIPIGGLIVLIWHHQADGTAIADIRDFAGDYNAIEFSTGPYGGSIWFVISDLPGTYGDNSGSCEVILHQ